MDRVRLHNTHRLSLLRPKHMVLNTHERATLSKYMKIFSMSIFEICYYRMTSYNFKTSKDAHTWNSLNVVLLFFIISD